MKRLEQITLKQLRALQGVAATGNISAAADRLGLTGPAVHNQLKLLEDLMQSPLILREGRERNTVTPQGKVLLTAYAELRASLGRAITQINAINAGKAGSVVLGVVSTAKYFAPRIVALLQQDLPDIEVSLKVGNRGAIIAALERGEFDLCIMGRPPRQPLAVAEPLADHPHVIIAAADHPLAGSDDVASQALLTERFVMREQGSGTRILAARYLEEIGHPQETNLIEMSSNETIKQAVIAGLGIALISGHTVTEELRSGRLVALACRGLPIVRKWFLLSRPEKPLTTAAGAVRDWIVRHQEEIFPRLP